MTFSQSQIDAIRRRTESLSTRKRPELPPPGKLRLSFSELARRNH